MKLDATARSELARNKEITEEGGTKSARQELAPEKVDEIEKASGDESGEPTYQEILDTFKKGLEAEELENDQSVQKEPDVIQTAEANSKVFPAQDAMENSNEESLEIKENLEPANSAEDALDEETVELAQADTPKAEESSSSNQSSSPSSGAEAAATGPSSIFGSVAMVPVAAVGIQQLVEKVTEGSAPIGL